MPEFDHSTLAPHQQQLLSSARDKGYGLWAGVKLIEMGERLARISFPLRNEMLTPWGR